MKRGIMKHTVAQKSSNLGCYTLNKLPWCLEQ